MDKVPGPVLACLETLNSAGSAPSWTLGSELSSGRRNRAWLAEGGGGRAVIRLHDGDNDQLLGLDRERELRAHRAAAAAGLAPAILHVDTAAGVLVTEYIEGEALRGDDHRALAWLGQQLRRLHQLPLDLEPRDMIAHAERYRRALADTAFASDPCDRCPPLADALQRYRQRSRADRFCHFDPIPENVRVAADRVWLLDWEYAARGDAAMDLAAVVEGAGLSPAATDTFVTAYGGLDREQLLLARIVYRYVEVLWYRLLALDGPQRAAVASGGHVAAEQALRCLLAQIR